MAGGYRLAQAYVAIVPSMAGIGKAIEAAFEGPAKSTGRSAGETAGTAFSGTLASTLNSSMSKVVSGVGKVFAGIGKAGLAATTAAVPAIGMIGKSALDAYATWEQAVGGVDTLFKDASGTVQKYAAEAYKNAGVSANDYMNQVTSFAASLVSSLGGDTAAAAEAANTALVDMSDNANKMGTDLGALQFAYQGFAKQNYTMLDNLKLGYGGTKTEMQRLIDDANKLGAAQGKSSDLTIEKFSDVVEAIHRVQENLNITGTTSREAATTIEGSIGSMKAAWANWLAELGKDNADMAGLTSQLAESVVAVARNVIPRVREIAEGALSGIAESIGQFIAQADFLPNSFLTALPSIYEFENAVKDGSVTLQDIAKNAGLAVGAFAGFTAVGGNVDSILNVFDTLGSVGDKAFSGFDKVQGAAKGAFGLFDDLGTRWGNALGLVDANFGGIFGMMSNRVKSGFDGIGTTLAGMFDSRIYVPLQQGIGGIGSKIASPFQTLAGNVSGFLSPVTSAFGTAFQGFGTTLAAPIQAGLNGVGTIISGFFQPANFMKFFGIAAIAGALVVGLGMLNQSMNGQLSVMISGFFAQLPSYIAQFQAWVTSQLPALMQSGMQLLTSVLEGITANLPQMLTAATAILTTLVDGIANNLPTLVPIALQLILTLVQGIGSNLPKILQSGLNLLAKFVEGIINAIPQLVAALPKIITTFVDGILGMLPQIMTTGMNLLLKFINGIIKALPDLIAAIPEIISAFSNTIVRHLPQIVSTGMELLGQFVIGILKALPSLLGVVGSIPGQIIRALGNVGSLLWNAGASIMQGFLNGLKSIWGDITSFVGNIADWIASHKGPLSYDRRLLIPAGEAIMGGFRKSLNAGWRNVQNDIRGMNAGISAGMLPPSANYAYAAARNGFAYTPASTGKTGANVQITNYYPQADPWPLKVNTELDGAVVGL